MVVSERALYGTVDIQKKNVLRFPDTEVFRHTFTAMGTWVASPASSIIDALPESYDETGASERVSNARKLPAAM